MTDVQWPRRVCRYELQQYSWLRLFGLPAVARTLVENGFNFCVKSGRAQIKVDETRPGNFDFIDGVDI